jgi:hypothetical protein
MEAVTIAAGASRPSSGAFDRPYLRLYPRILLRMQPIFVLPLDEAVVERGGRMPRNPAPGPPEQPV